MRIVCLCVYFTLEFNKKKFIRLTTTMDKTMDNLNNKKLSNKLKNTQHNTISQMIIKKRENFQIHSFVI